MDFNSTRMENDDALLSQIDSIKTADNIQVLIPFAKAYLGMYYVIDKSLAEKEKVKLLANDELAEAILDGFVASLNLKELPSIEKIGQLIAKNKEFAEGYVILAGMDLVAKRSLTDINALNLDIIEKAIGFHFSNKSGYRDIWFDYLLAEHKNKIMPALSKYWVAMLGKTPSYLPGKNLVLGKNADDDIIQYCILPLLDNWKNCKAKTLFQLLRLAFLHSNMDKFLEVCERTLENDENLNERTRLYWISAAYLISPDQYFAKLSNYVGRVKLKIMPLLDFIVLIMADKNKLKITLDTKIVVQLIRLIAPIFPPQHHVYGAIGALDINSKNVMKMFHFLLSSNDADTVKEIKSLRKTRVMKIYSAVIDNFLDLHQRIYVENTLAAPGLDEYVKIVIEENCLQCKSNKFDIR